MPVVSAVRWRNEWLEKQHSRRLLNLHFRKCGVKPDLRVSPVTTTFDESQCSHSDSAQCEGVVSHNKQNKNVLVLVTCLKTKNLWKDNLSVKRGITIYLATLTTATRSAWQDCGVTTPNDRCYIIVMTLSERPWRAQRTLQEFVPLSSDTAALQRAVP